MPGKSGLDICREVRAHSPVPIILLTAKDAEVDKVVGLEVVPTTTSPSRSRSESRSAGCAPSPPARARPLERREGTAIEAGPVSIDLARHLVSVRGEPINLTRSEFQVLRLPGGESRPGLLAQGDHGGALADRVPGRRPRACDVHISNLRQKVERDPQNPELVLTVRRVGYRFAEVRDSASRE